MLSNYRVNCVTRIFHIVLAFYESLYIVNLFGWPYGFLQWLDWYNFDSVFSAPYISELSSVLLNFYAVDSLSKIGHRWSLLKLFEKNPEYFIIKTLQIEDLVPVDFIYFIYRHTIVKWVVDLNTSSLCNDHQETCPNQYVVSASWML